MDWIVAVCTAKMACAIATGFCWRCPWGLVQSTDKRRKKIQIIDAVFRLVFLKPVICMNTGWGCLIPTAFRDFLLVDVYKFSTAATEAIGHDKDYKYLSRKTLSLFVIVDCMLSCSLWNVRSHHFLNSNSIIVCGFTSLIVTFFVILYKPFTCNVCTSDYIIYIV